MSITTGPALEKWIARYLADNPPRAKSLIMTLFGDVIAPHGGQVWLGSLIDLLAPFRISERLVRTSVFRLAEEGWLGAQREGRRSRYALNSRTAMRFQRAYQQVYAPVSREWDRKWTLLFATPGTVAADRRAELRKELLWQGFGTIAPLVFGHPSPDAKALEETLERVGAKGNAFVCTATEADIVSGARPLNGLIEQCWDLTGVIADYDRLLGHFGRIPRLLEAGDAIDPQHAFVIRTLLIHEYRRTQLHDPQLPLELLPMAWPGKTAYDLCRMVYRASCPSAEQYVMNTLSAHDKGAPEAAPYFHQRFGAPG